MMDIEDRILLIGIAPREYVKQRTIEIARGKPLAPGEPKHWVSSLESLARVLSEKNMLLIEMIRNSHPQSLAELAKLSGRAKSNLSRTLQSMEKLGLVEISMQSRGRKVPTVVYDKVRLECAVGAAKPKAAA